MTLDQICIAIICVPMLITLSFFSFFAVDYHMGKWFEWWRETFGVIDNEQTIAYASVFLGGACIAVPILVVTTYMHLTGMELMEFLRYPWTH
jgi:hypothetical protein